MTLLTLVISNFGPFRSIYHCYRDSIFGQAAILIPNFGPFRSISYRFRDNIFGLTKILRKFCKIPARRPICFGYMPKTNQIYYNPCDPKFALSLTVSEIKNCCQLSEVRTFSKKLAKVAFLANLEKL